MAEIKLNNVIKNYGNTEVVHSINLDISHNEFIVLVGPSGCGKSTTLRMIAGLEEISGGEIKIGNRVVNDLPPRDRNISMVFQNYALYPHMSVRDNLGFGLKIAKKTEQEIAHAVDEAAEILGLTDYMDRTPGELSGGQRQRVAMGRAIVRHPDVFLFDEPLSNLDAKLRGQMRVEIKRLHKKVKTTIVYVTHDQIEAMTLADRIVVMKDGYIVQTGTPLEVFEKPINTFVAGFIGSPAMNLIDAEIKSKKIIFGDGKKIPVPKNYIKKLKDGDKVTFGFRADNLIASGHSMSSGGQEVELDFEISIAEPLGAETILFSTFGGQEIQAKMHNPRAVNDGEIIKAILDLDKCHIFDAKSGSRIEGDS